MISFQVQSMFAGKEITNKKVSVSSTIINEELGCCLNTKDEKGFFTDTHLPLFR